MTSRHGGGVAIVGASETREVGVLPDRSMIQLHAEAALLALADAGLTAADRLPMNTNGGGLSYTHTGMYGMFAIQEAVRQLRGEAAAQVPGVTISFVQGVGGFFWAAGSLVLSNRQP
jgi:acetyl-CoA acetyltransferase